jgi:phage shock protein C
MAKKSVKRLYRASEKNSMVGGVCAGIAEYFVVDPTLIRLAWILMTIFSLGAGFFGYLITWVVMPIRS